MWVKLGYQLEYQHVRDRIVLLGLHIGVIQSIPKLLHDRMTSLQKSQIPFANSIASFCENMFQALNP